MYRHIITTSFYDEKFFMANQIDSALAHEIVARFFILGGRVFDKIIEGTK